MKLKLSLKSLLQLSLKIGLAMTLSIFCISCSCQRTPKPDSLTLPSSSQVLVPSQKLYPGDEFDVSTLGLTPPFQFSDGGSGYLDRIIGHYKIPLLNTLIQDTIHVKDYRGNSVTASIRLASLRLDSWNQENTLPGKFQLIKIIPQDRTSINPSTFFAIGTITNSSTSIFNDVDSNYFNPSDSSKASWVVLKSMDSGTSWSIVDNFSLSPKAGCIPEDIFVLDNEVLVIGKTTGNDSYNLTSHSLIRKSDLSGTVWKTIYDLPFTPYYLNSNVNYFPKVTNKAVLTQNGDLLMFTSATNNDGSRARYWWTAYSSQDQIFSQEKLTEFEKLNPESSYNSNLGSVLGLIQLKSGKLLLIMGPGNGSGVNVSTNFYSNPITLTTSNPAVKLFRSDDRGRNWKHNASSSTFSGLVYSNNSDVSTSVFSHSNSQGDLLQFAIFNSSLELNQAIVVKSTDDGLTWVTKNTFNGNIGCGEDSCIALTVNALGLFSTLDTNTNNDALFAVSAYNSGVNPYGGNDKYRVIKSADDGETWTTVADASGVISYPQLISNNKWITQTNSGTFMSNDQGVSWTSRPDLATYQIPIFSSNRFMGITSLPNSNFLTYGSTYNSSNYIQWSINFWKPDADSFTTTIFSKGIWGNMETLSNQGNTLGQVNVIKKVKTDSGDLKLLAGGMSSSQCLLKLGNISASSWQIIDIPAGFNCSQILDIAQLGDNSIVLLFTDSTDFFIAQSFNLGQTFGTPITLNLGLIRGDNSSLQNYHLQLQGSDIYIIDSGSSGAIYRASIKNLSLWNKVFVNAYTNSIAYYDYYNYDSSPKKIAGFYKNSSEVYVLVSDVESQKLYYSKDDGQSFALKEEFSVSPGETTTSLELFFFDGKLWQTGIGYKNGERYFFIRKSDSQLKNWTLVSLHKSLGDGYMLTHHEIDDNDNLYFVINTPGFVGYLWEVLSFR